MGNEVDQFAGGRPGYIPGLDGIRAVAIGLVLFSHSVTCDEFTALRPFGLRAGSAGVVVFFVLSGYLITTLLLREEDRTGGISLRLFYLRRAFRLFPALWLYLLVVGTIWLAGGLPHHPWKSFVVSLLYIRNLVGWGRETEHLWSLCIEEQFYLLWPLVMVALHRRDRLRLLAATFGITVIIVWRAYVERYGLVSGKAIYMRSDFRFDAPLFGCALALAQRVSPPASRLANPPVWCSAVLAIAGAVGLVIWVVFDVDKVFSFGIGLTVVSLLSMFLIVSQIGAQGWGSRWLATPPLVAIGCISYGLYLWQQLFVGPLIPGFDRIRAFPFDLIATFAVATASYWLLERPLIRLKDRRFHKTALHGIQDTR